MPRLIGRSRRRDRDHRGRQHRQRTRRQALLGWRFRRSRRIRIRRLRCEARAGVATGSAFSIASAAGWHPARHVSGNELIHQLVQAGLPAQMFGAGAQAAVRSPPGDAQFATMRVRHEPVIGLPFFCPADVARNGLPDHRFSRSAIVLNGRRFHRGKTPTSISSRIEGEEERESKTLMRRSGFEQAGRRFPESGNPVRRGSHSQSSQSVFSSSLPEN